MPVYTQYSLLYPTQHSNNRVDCYRNFNSRLGHFVKRLPHPSIQYLTAWATVIEEVFLPKEQITGLLAHRPLYLPPEQTAMCLYIIVSWHQWDMWHVMPLIVHQSHTPSMAEKGDVIAISYSGCLVKFKSMNSLRKEVYLLTTMIATSSLQKPLYLLSHSWLIHTVDSESMHVPTALEHCVIKTPFLIYKWSCDSQVMKCDATSTWGQL